MKRWSAVILSALVVFAVMACQSAPKPGPAATDSPEKARAKALVKGESDGDKPAAAADSKPTPAPTAAPVDSVSESDLPAEPTPEEMKFLENYLGGLKYMVYYDEGAGIAPQIAKTAIAQANRYLIEKMGVQPIDLETIEKKKADEKAAFETETGGSMDYIQFIAQKLNADVYVEISLSVQNETANSKFYSTASGSMKIFNASTGELLGSLAMNSPKTTWSTQDGATNNAISASVWMGMPKMADQSKALLKSAWKDGIRYDVVIQTTPDSKKISQMKRQLGKKIRKVSQDSFSAAETRWSLFTFKKGDSIEDLVYEAADFAGMKDIYLVYQRGKSFVFNSGL